MNLDETIKYCRENEAQQYDEASLLMQRQEHIGSTGRNPKNCYANTIKRVLEDADRYKQIASLLIELKERREADRLILVSERLPETADYVLATDGYGKFVAWYHEGNWHSYNAQVDQKNRPIIGWQPLPRPYESEDMI